MTQSVESATPAKEEARSPNNITALPTSGPGSAPAGYLERKKNEQATEEDKVWELTQKTADAEQKRIMAARQLQADAERILQQVHRDREKRGDVPLDDANATVALPDDEEIDALADAGTFTLEEFLEQDFPDPGWIVEDAIPSGGLGMLLAAEKTGKSLFTVDVADAIAHAEEFLGFKTKQVNVLIIEEEGSPAAWQKRIRKMLGGRIASSVRFRHRQNMDLTDPKQIAVLRRLIVKHDIGLVFMGPLAQIGNLEDENKSDGINKICKTLNGVIRDTGGTVTIFLIHHRKKPQGNDTYSSVSSFFRTSRGNSALYAAVDVAIGLQREQEDATGKYFISLRDGAAKIGFYHLDITGNLRMSPSDEAPKSSLARHEAAVINFMLKADRPLTRREIEKGTTLSERNASTALRSRQEAGRVQKIGSGPSTQWQLDPDFRAELMGAQAAESDYN